MQIARLIYERKGRGYMETGDAARLAKKLETLRCDAELFEVNEKGQVGERIGGCERAEGHDDRRIKWAWWYDRGACGMLTEGMYRVVSSGSAIVPRFGGDGHWWGGNPHAVEGPGHFPEDGE